MIQLLWAVSAVPGHRMFSGEHMQELNFGRVAVAETDVQLARSSDHSLSSATALPVILMLNC